MPPKVNRPAPAGSVDIVGVEGPQGPAGDPETLLENVANGQAVGRDADGNITGISVVSAAQVPGLLVRSSAGALVPGAFGQTVLTADGSDVGDLTVAAFGGVVTSANAAASGKFNRFKLTSDLSEVDDWTIVTNPLQAGVFDQAGDRVSNRDVRVTLTVDGTDIDDLTVVTI